jgi:aspartate aminotransferase-like enzyme
MISKRINLSTGPVNISPEVQKAVCNPALSHRSNEFVQLFDHTTELLCRMFSVQQAYIMSGSGTLANEVMLHQIKILDAKGLILSNGEFGSRLIHQAERIGLNFKKYELKWGQSFGTGEISSMLQSGEIKWMLFCHCETSTGVLNNLDALTILCNQYKCLCFVDCISSVGTLSLNLSSISMATASSGKGLASYCGLALLLSNIQPKSDNRIPLYYDLLYYSQKNKIPFTISSNLVAALNIAIVQKSAENQPELIQKYCEKYYAILYAYNLVPFGNTCSKVFTIVLPKEKKSVFIDQMKDKQIDLSYESEYLKKRDWSQLAVFGYYQESQLLYASNALEQSLQDMFGS